jgi:hypothetical protein
MVMLWSFVILSPRFGIFYQEKSGANPTIVSYNATSSLLRSEDKNIFFYFEKRTRLQQR